MDTEIVGIIVLAAAIVLLFVLGGSTDHVHCETHYDVASLFGCPPR